MRIKETFQLVIRHVTVSAHNGSRIRDEYVMFVISGESARGVR
jgi:hypothetical protein